jgi:hypothetical protein
MQVDVSVHVETSAHDGIKLTYILKRFISYSFETMTWLFSFV